MQVQVSRDRRADRSRLLLCWLAEDQLTAVNDNGWLMSALEGFNTKLVWPKLVPGLFYK